jgi:hypothetical protein
MMHFLNRLHDGEHAGLGRDIVNKLKAAISGISLLAPLWDAYETAVEHETLIFKVSRASFETKEIATTDAMRDRDFRETRHRLKFHAGEEDQTRAHAAGELLFLIKPFNDADKRSLFEETAFINAFLQKVAEPGYAQYVAALPGFDSLLAGLDALNTKLDNLYLHRMEAVEELKLKGKRADMRIEVDHAFVALLEAINSLHHYTVLSGTEPAMKASLEETALYINALIDQLKKILAHRSHSRRKHAESTPDDKGEADKATQTDEADKAEKAKDAGKE